MSSFRPPRRIVYTGDFLRPSVAGDRPTQHHNIRWLRNLLSTQIEMATGLPHITFGWDANGGKDAGLTAADVESIYRNFGLSRDIRSWAAIHGQTELPRQLELIIEHVFRDSLVIGFEIPPLIEHYLTRHGIPFIAATVHPVRFLDDIYLALRSNVAVVQDAIFGHRIPEGYLCMMAGVQKASAARYFREQVASGSALFLMQTWYDQSHIDDGRFTDASAYMERISTIAAAHSEMLIKEHPLAPNPSTILLLARLPNARLVVGNVYGFLSIPEVRTVVAVSSSVGIEAPYFGCPAEFLLRSPVKLRRTDADPKDGYVGVLDAYLCPDFWRRILENVTPVSELDGFVVPFKPNRLRISMRSFWNFNEIDTDITAGFGQRERG